MMPARPQALIGQEHERKKEPSTANRGRVSEVTRGNLRDAISRGIIQSPVRTGNGRLWLTPKPRRLGAPDQRAALALSTTEE